MRRDIFKLMGLLFIPDNFIIVVQEIGGTLAVQRLVLAGKHHQAAIAVLLAEVGHALGGDVSILFRSVDFAFHVLMRKQVWIEHRLADIAQKTLEVSGIVQGNETLVDNNRENIVRLNSVIEMFHDEK